MFGRTLRLFRVFGFEVRVNVSWAFLAILIAISLARGFFPATYAGWPAATYWWMAAAGVIGVFASIVIHELSHSLAARAMGMEMKGITLFLFGGMAEMDQEPASAKGELVMALAGPAISLVLAALLLGLAALGRGPEGAGPAVAVIDYLGWLNLILAVFNLIPAFPMDGGRALRATLWAISKDLRWATRWASRMGALFGLALIVLGVVSALQGAFVAGLWWILIGMFIRAAASGSYQQMEIRRLMTGVRAEDVMHPLTEAVPADMTLAALVDRYVYATQQPAFPVVEDGGLVGVIGLAEIRTVPRADWETTPVRAVMIPADRAEIVAPTTDAMDAVAKLQTHAVDALIVADGHRPVGVLAQSDVLKLLSLKMDLEAR
ncbi:site-2 protease family protein [Roseospira goensis]|uniref:Zinc metalloprotease n=1 Tax=Roseospira goensis TaxID=391922 RepID=A0A7W6WKT6_9PROT|nr:site-2 protease family protein [Roseospira goensis]MBB4285692.1 Zn-dependent protease/CBS domain-containing protein [Roseospira goensis]